MENINKYISEKLKLDVSLKVSNLTYNSDYVCDNINEIENLDDIFNEQVLKFIEENTKNLNWPMYVWQIKSGNNKLYDFCHDDITERRKRIFGSEVIPNLKSESKSVPPNIVCLCNHTNRNFVEIYVIKPEVSWIIFNED